jgi:hypothetical protein
MSTALPKTNSISLPSKTGVNETLNITGTCEKIVFKLKF